jgi:hypothetical protein
MTRPAIRTGTVTIFLMTEFYVWVWMRRCDFLAERP